MFEKTQEMGKETGGRGFILSHTGGIDDPEFKRYPTKWTDDTRADWTVEDPTKDFYSWMPQVALKENIAMYTDPSKKTSKIPFLTNDMGDLIWEKRVKQMKSFTSYGCSFRCLARLQRSSLKPEIQHLTCPGNIQSGPTAFF